ncbi:MAG: hypothetical protein V7K92_21425 [Nostoc sp.]|uniref:hypothetical protein n=1 Tax=Nostoc sp. TaxID=1180 RepID=UPI002FF24BFB
MIRVPIALPGWRGLRGGWGSAFPSGDGAIAGKNLISLITTHADSPRKSDVYDGLRLRSICWLMSVL